MAIGLTACKKDLSEIPVPGKNVPITVTIDQNNPGFPVSPVFEGLSYETRLLGQSPDYLNENNTILVQLVKNLGRGILRIGGNSSDEIQWTGAERTDETPPNSLTTSDIDRLSTFSKATGWPVLFGLNLGNYDVDNNAKEALYVYNSLQGDLYALQSGNEPDVFKFGLRKPNYNYHDFQQEWDTYFSAVKAVAPKAHFAGPDVDPFNPGWFSTFASNEHNNVRVLDSHYYCTGPASNANISYNDILKPNPQLDGLLVQLSKIAASARLPYRMSECNSVFGGGKPGVSDVFASALWALDYMWDVAQNKGAGVNFHGGDSRFAYTPITMENDSVIARPEYYAMLAFKYGSTGGRIIPAMIADPRNYNNCTVYACSNGDNTWSVTLINKEKTNDFDFTIKLSKTASTIKVARLTAPSLTSKKGTTFAGAAVNADGTFTPPRAEEYTINSKAFVVTVSAGSAAVVTVE